LARKNKLAFDAPMVRGHINNGLGCRWLSMMNGINRKKATNPQACANGSQAGHGKR
jgi:hypothetical protein